MTSEPVRRARRWAYVVLLVTLAGLVAVLAGLWRLAIRARRRGISGSMLGPFDELWHPAAFESHVEIQLQTERRAASANGDD